MSPELIGVLGLILLLVVITIGVPIGIALGLVGLVGIAVITSPEASLIKVGVVSFDVVSRYDLGVLPLFLLMAHLCFAAGASRDFFDVAARFIGHRRGGLALASIAGCAGFGAISGSSLATVATIGSAALPEMRRAGYNPGFACGALAAGGTLGALIPPSGALIVFGIIAEQSIGRLFAAAILPGLTQALFYMFAISLLCYFNPALGPSSKRVSMRDRLASLVKIIDVFFLVVLVIGGLTVGWFTPTEAASVGVALAIVLCAIRGALSFSVLVTAFVETLRTSGMIYLIIIGAMLFATFISITGIAEFMSNLVLDINAGPITAIIVMAILFLVLGSFLDGLALMLLVTPIFLPIAVELGYSPIWFGIFLVRAMEVGFILPPLGLNAYVIHGIAKDIELSAIFKGIGPFLIADVLHLGLIIALPVMVLWLPSVVGV